jgi:2-oxoglutarate dehydrogenase E2 component (dihydrolipoamide succinyltransferase)
MLRRLTSYISRGYKTPAVGSSLSNKPSRGNLVVRAPCLTTVSSRHFSNDSKKHIIEVPVLGDSISEGTIVEVCKVIGDGCFVDDVVAVVETDKVSVDVRSPVNGTVKEVYVEVDDIVEVGTPLFEVDLTDVKKIVLENSESVEMEEESSKETKIQQPDVSSAQKSALVSPSSDVPEQQPSFRSESRVKMSRMRSRIAQRLKESQNTAAMLTTFNEVDMSNAVKLRQEYKDEFEKKHDVRLGFMSLFVKACSEALVETPSVNAVIDDACNEIVYRDYVDISIAVASPRGLVVPVLRNVESMSFLDIERSISYFALKAKNNEVALEDMAGGTFTISNGGVFGSMLGTPIINPPQSAILGMHSIKQRPVVIGEQVVPRPIMYLALTYDHRLIDGREAVTFLRSVCDKVENPSRLLLTL